MLLRRVIEHVKTQNWTAVALDFLIVVVGVFVGIQVSNWNDTRATTARSAQLLDRLEEEFRVFESALSSSSDDLALFETSSVNVLNTIRDNTLDTTDPDNIAKSLAYVRQMSRPPARSAVLLEMISSGELSLLPEDIRLAVTQFDQQIQRNEYLWPEAVGFLTSSIPLWDAVDYAPLGSPVLVRAFDADKLRLAESNIEIIMIYQGALHYAVSTSLRSATEILEMIEANRTERI